MIQDGQKTFVGRLEVGFLQHGFAQSPVPVVSLLDSFELFGAEVGHPFAAQESGQPLKESRKGPSAFPVDHAAVVDARGAAGWDIGDETAFWIVLPLIALWGIWALLRQVFPR